METKFLEISKALFSGRKERLGTNIVGTGEYMFALAPDGSAGRRYSAQTWPESDIDSTVKATPAVISSVSSAPYALSDGMTLNITVDGVSWVVTLSASDFDDIAAATASEVGLVLTNEGIGIVGYNLGDKTYIKTNSIGASSSVQVTGGTANVVLNFSTTAHVGGNEFHVTANAYQNLIGWSLGDYSEVTQDVDLTTYDFLTGSFRGSCEESLKIEQWCFSILVDGVIRAHRIIDSRDLTYTESKAPVSDLAGTHTVTLRLQLVPGADYDQIMTPSMEVDLSQGTRGYSGTTIYTKTTFGGMPSLQYWWILLFGHNVTMTWWDTQGNSGDLGVVTVHPMDYTLSYTGSAPVWVAGDSRRVFLTVRPYTECSSDEKEGLFVASDGKSLGFDGTDAYVNIPDSNDLDVGDEFAMFAVIKPLDLFDRYIFCRKTGGIVSYGMKTGDGDLSLYYECDGESLDSGFSLSSGWNYSIIIVDGTSVVFILVNDSGVQVSTKTRTKITPAQTADLNIGTDLTTFLNAKIERVGLYTEKISQGNGEDIAQGRVPAMGDLRVLYYLTRGTGTNIRDFSLSRNHGSIQGSCYSWESDAPETYGNGIGTPEAWL